MPEMRVLVEPPAVMSSVRARPASSTALSAMNHNNTSTSTSTSSSSSSQHLSVLAKVLRMFRSHSDSSMARPPSPPRRRAAAAASSHGPSRSASASPISAQQQVKQQHHHHHQHHHQRGGAHRPQSAGSGSGSGGGQQRRRYQRVVRNENAPPPDQPDDNPFVVRKFTQEFLANYYAGKSPGRPSSDHKSAPCLSSSLPAGSGVPGHTILKKSVGFDSVCGEGETGSEAPGAAGHGAGVLGHSPSLPNRHAKFRDVVEIVEFAEKDQVKTGVHFAHEEQLHDDDDELVHSVNTPSECSSTTSDDQVLFFAEDEDDPDKTSTTRSVDTSSTNGTSSPDLPVPAASPRHSPRPSDAGDDHEAPGDAASNENVLSNIFTSLSEAGAAGETQHPQQQHHQQPARSVKHVRLMDTVEHVERHDDDDYS